MKVGFVIGRFSIFHNAHYNLVQSALNECDRVLVLLGSHLKARDPKDPFTVTERQEMVSSCFSPADKAKLVFAGLVDFQDDLKWKQEVCRIVEKFKLEEEAEKIVFYTFKKDDTTAQYIDLFKNFEKRYVTSCDLSLNATCLRKAYFGSQAWETEISQKVPAPVIEFLTQFKKGSHFHSLQKYYDVVEQCIAKYGKGPFYTADCLVKKADKFLFIVRKGDIGEGQLAVPGGFIEPFDISPKRAALREFQEELNCDQKDLVNIEYGFKHCIKVINPARSLRGDIRTTAFLFEVPFDYELNLRGSEETFEYKWLTMAEIEEHRDQFFEDHYFMVKNLLAPNI